MGDVVGRIGRQVLAKRLPEIQAAHHIDFTIVNLENAAGGFGITPKIYAQLAQSKIDMFTSGNHVYDKKEALVNFDQFDLLVRPINYPEGSPGVGIRYAEIGGVRVAVINAIGRVFMSPVDCPFRKMDAVLDTCDADIIIVDFHAESTSEKMAMGWYLAGRVSAVYGTHTHVMTADDQLLDNHTAYISDVGMTGPQSSVIGMDPTLSIKKFLSPVSVRLDVPNTRLGQVNAIIVKIDKQTGQSLSIERVFDRVGL